MSTSEVLEITDRAAVLIAALPEDQRSGWVCYIFEALDGIIGEQDTEKMITEVKETIDTRLTWGG